MQAAMLMLLVLIEDRESDDLQVSDANQHALSTSDVPGTTVDIGYGVPSTHDVQTLQEPWVSMNVGELHQIGEKLSGMQLDKKEKLNNENWLQRDVVLIDR